MSYKMNISNELAQIKNCRTLEEIEEFLEDHNLELDHWYSNYDISQFVEGRKGLYVIIIATYQDVNGTSIQIIFNF